jgi:hypothetical protein
MPGIDAIDGDSSALAGPVALPPVAPGVALRAIRVPYSASILQGFARQSAYFRL